MIAPVRVAASIPNTLLGLVGRGFRAFAGLALSTRILAFVFAFSAVLTMLLGVGGTALAQPSTTPGAAAPEDSGTGGTPGASPSTAPAAGDKPKMSGADWDKLNQCEAGGKWDTNTGNGFAGGLQFDSGTWSGNGGTDYAETADKATREEQIKVAQTVLSKQGFGAWPTCTSQEGFSDETRSREPATEAELAGDTAPATSDSSPSTTASAPAKDDEKKDSDKTTATGGSVPADVEGDAEAGRSGSPKAFLERARATSDIRDAAKYLTFSRYYGSTMVPEPQSENLASSWGGGLLTSLAGLFFSIASLGVYLFGQIMIFTISMDLLKQGLFTADKIFWKTTTELLNFDGSTGQNMMQGVTILVAAGVVIWMVSRFAPQLARGKVSTQGLFIAGLALMAVVVMGNAAAKNHMESSSGDKAPIASMMSTQDLITPNKSTASDWATFSPGWVVQKGYGISHVVGGWLSDAVGVMTNSMFEGLGRSDGMCSTYVTGMHAVYKNTQASKDTNGADALLLSYDRLVGQLYYRTYMIAIGGSTVSANNAWCRVAEAQAGSSPGDQALIGRASGLYSDAIGSGGLGVVDNQPNHVVNPDTFSKPAEDGVVVPVGGGTMVNADGEWANSNTSDAVSGATKFFGPTLRNGSGAMAFRFYFAACQWEQGKPVSLNPEWTKVRKAQNDDVISLDRCKGEVISGKKDEGFGQEYEADDNPSSRDWNYSTVNDAFIEEDKSILDKVRDGVSRITTGLGLKSDGRDGIRSKFDDAYDANGENPARTYYESMSGDNPTTSLLMSLLALVMVGAIFKFFVTMALGAVVTAAMALVIMLLMVFLLVLLLIPIKSVTEFVVNCLKTVLSATFVTTVIVVAFDMMFTIAALFSAFAEVASTNPLGQALLIAAANILAAFCFVRLFQGLFNINLTNPAGGMAATMMGAAPLLQSMGKPVYGPMDREFYNRHMGGRGGRGDGGSGSESVSQEMRKEQQRRIEADQPLRVDKGRGRGLKDRMEDARADGTRFGKSRVLASTAARGAGKATLMGGKAAAKATSAGYKGARTTGRLGGAFLQDVYSGGNTGRFSDKMGEEGLHASQLNGRAKASLWRAMSPRETQVTDSELRETAGHVIVNPDNLEQHQQGVYGAEAAPAGTDRVAPGESRAIMGSLASEAESAGSGGMAALTERQVVQGFQRQNNLIGELPSSFSQRPSGLIVPGRDSVSGEAIDSGAVAQQMNAQQEIAQAAGLQATRSETQAALNSRSSNRIAQMMQNPNYASIAGQETWAGYQAVREEIRTSAATQGYNPADRSQWTPEQRAAINDYTRTMAQRSLGPVADMRETMRSGLDQSGWMGMASGAARSAADQARHARMQNRLLGAVERDLQAD